MIVRKSHNFRRIQFKLYGSTVKFSPVAISCVGLGAGSLGSVFTRIRWGYILEVTLTDNKGKSMDKLTPEMLDEIIETLGLLAFQPRPAAERSLQKDRLRLIEILRDSRLAKLVLEENSDVLSYIDRWSSEDLFQDWFLIGWHARGAVEETARLEEMIKR
jgi:hypothetical protein